MEERENPGLRAKLAALFQKKWFTALLLLAGALGVGLLTLCFSVTANRALMLQSYLKRPLLMTLNLLPPVLLCFFLWFLTNRAVIAYGITGAGVFGLALANWFKLQFRNDPLMFEDLLLAKEAGNMLGRYSLFMTPMLAAALACIVGWGVVIFFCGRGRFRSVFFKNLQASFRAGWLRFALAAVLLAAVFPLSKVYGDNRVYSTHTANFDHANRWSATDVYTSKGFVYPFLYSVKSAFETPPEGYHKEAAQALLAKYEDREIPKEKRVDMVSVMLEAYNDLSKFEEIPFVQDPYASYHALEAESFTGNLVTSVFAAGTVKTERSFLTGYETLSSFRRATNSYPWYFKSQGYTATGSHPCYNWFYNRVNINPNLGLDDYLFFEEHYGELAGGNIARDKILFPEMFRLHQEAVDASQAPYFSFSVTYQGHGPYNTGVNDWGQDFIQPGKYSQETENIVNNYLGSVKSTSEELAAFVDSYRELDRPVVIVVFGDHNPWMGDGNSAYQEMGIDLGQDHKEGFLNYYSTRYLIWANDAAKKILGNDFAGEGPDISPCFLMNQVFQLCGWDGPAYMQYTDELMADLPVIQPNGTCVTAEGSYLPEPEGETAERILEFQQVEYYMRHAFLYGQ